jgi:hypothetical protein
VAEKTFQKVKTRLQNSTRFQNFEETDTGFSLTDKKDQVLLFTSHENRIYVFIGSDKTNTEQQLKALLK